MPTTNPPKAASTATPNLLNLARIRPTSMPTTREIANTSHPAHDAVLLSKKMPKSINESTHKTMIVAAMQMVGLKSGFPKTAIINPPAIRKAPKRYE